MRLKKWSEFYIGESVDHWVNKEDINSMFLPFIDEEYEVFIEDGVFETVEKKYNFLDPKHDVILSGIEYFPGYKITIKNSSNRQAYDLTLDFRNIVSSLERIGYFVKIDDTDGNIPIKNLYFYKGGIITWIPEDEDRKFPEAAFSGAISFLKKGEDGFEASQQQTINDGDVYIDSSTCTIYVRQDELVEFSPKDLADLYKWKCDQIGKGGSICCYVDIEDMASLMLYYRETRYKDWLINGISDDIYYSSEYQPDTQSLFSYHLDKENKILAIKCLIKQYGGLEEMVKESDNLTGKSEEEVIDFLLKERYYRTLDDLCADSDIIGDIKQEYGDWSAQSTCSENEKELIEEFDSIVEKEMEYVERVLRPGKRFWLKKVAGTDRKEKVYYDDNVWYYTIPFDNKWISENESGIEYVTLRDVFYEWASNKNFNYELNPNFSDYGDVDDVTFNKEVKNRFDDYLRK